MTTQWVTPQRQRKDVLKVAIPAISVIIPARNEAENIAAVVAGLGTHLARSFGDIGFEIIVADNGSEDATPRIATAAGARLIVEPRPGYGAACWAACECARGEYFLFVDGDGSANVKDSVRLLRVLLKGADLVIGVRMHPEPGSMSVAQRFGNRLACGLLKWLWGIPAKDLGPHRAVRRAAFEQMQMADRSYGWTVEMQVKAAMQQLAVTEIMVSWHARAGGYSKIGGTFFGVLRAGTGILWKIFRLWLKHPFRFDNTFFTPLNPSAEINTAAVMGGENVTPPCLKTQ